MTSHYNRSAIFLIYWLGTGDELDQSRIERLHQNQIDVIAFTSSQELQQATNKRPPHLLVISNNTDMPANMDIGITIKSSEGCSEITFLLITEYLDKESKEYFYQSGGNELILEPASLVEIFFRIKHLKLVFERSHQASIQIDEASQMALLAMENSSDLGATINFVKAATRCTDYESLANCILDAVESFSESAIVEMVGAETLNYYGTKNSVDPDLKKILISNKCEQRIVRFDNALQMNHQNLVLLAEGLPVDDVGRMGRIADNLAILTDTADRFVSELLLREQSKAIEIAKQRFISTISHELNTPMNAIQGFSKLIAGRGADDVLGKKGIKALESICSNSEKMKLIIQTLIQITESDSDRSQLSLDEIDVNSLILQLKNICTPLIKDKNITLLFPEFVDIQFKSDQKHITKMLFSLFDNAIKFTDNGEVELRVNPVSVPTIGDAIEFVVRDTGIGISENDLSQLFKNLGQLNINHDRSHYGAGLGLFYVQSYVKQLNGKIEANSVEGEGSEFVLTLPSNIKPILDDTELF